MTTTGKTIVLGVSGSIAAYKAADIASLLVKAGHSVHVVMTEAATKLIAPLTLQTLSRNPVHTTMWTQGSDWHPGHIDLADRADLLIVAPATAHTIARFAHGLADDLLSNIYLATRAPVILAPAMNGKMLNHPATQQNLATLKSRGHRLVEPVAGMLACGYEGEGKLAAVETIVSAVLDALSKE
ncbi:MAG: bifunctional phosphopantothenoylcysteine decarboxylase/phosphopantothenate--cysteine ligase CoaBC [Verrucomicrobia bacterium]|nr:bifunctional phosphopantothenoylcysteine decarboxylase/phosphopantothenate--cysteine ligase CoaBC [Verrucomicrobiota bacterium]